MEADCETEESFNPLDAGALLQTVASWPDPVRVDGGFNPLDAGALLQTSLVHPLADCRGVSIPSMPGRFFRRGVTFHNIRTYGLVSIPSMPGRFFRQWTETQVLRGLSKVSIPSMPGRFFRLYP